jgi:CheY-like chemotaxis protein
MLRKNTMDMVAAKSILLVDDHQSFLAVVATQLAERNNNFSILTAGNGEEALRVLESHRVGLVVTDLKMPVMNGFEFILHIKKRYPSLPVIVLSSFLYPESEPQLRALGVSGYIDKNSFSLAALENMIMSSLVKSC